MLKNKLIYELFTHLSVGGKIITKKIINQTIKIIGQQIKTNSPTHLIETSIFNILLPVRYNIYKKKLIGDTLRQSITKVLILLIKYAKHMKNKQSISHKLAIIFIQLYKKDHILYKQKILLISKILNL